ncbi:GTP cyclohydrolase 1 type 2 [Alicyclobacillus contaminans]|uniref:Nif3-like dinuclear metal center hexameric protein n=1 Tax=Alicyclobacillus contaminans TaxID=392016 RepID=UPI0004196788|nr:Nif3-like dinuclear metal center hexameric protein [Alicyclobacillus contaminans]GMA52171.1 GTP cyclohydrolase 1 type 2 [Alicyclobacillus contaminans]
MSKVTVRDVMDVVHRHAPPELAMDGDVIGLQVGRLDKPVRRICLALDPSPSAIHAAISAQSDLLFTHHALIYRPLKVIDTSTARGRALQAALAADLAICNAHTNLDVAEGGVNDVLANLLGLQQVEVLDPLRRERLQKLVVFVPETHHEQVLQAVCAAGAGHIGQYSHCTFSVEGQGTFLPQAGAQPFIGEVGRLERVAEVRLETVVPEPLVPSVVRAMLAAHPYEEVAYDLYPLELPGKSFGIGRIGTLAEPMPLSAFSEQVRTRLGLAHIRFSGDPGMPVQRVAVLGGSGGGWAAKALAKGADVLVTADCSHHVVADAWDDGLAMIDATHAAMERPVLQAVQTWFNEAFGAAVQVHIADVEEDPFRWL